MQLCIHVFEFVIVRHTRTATTKHGKEDGMSGWPYNFFRGLEIPPDVCRVLVFTKALHGDVSFNRDLNHLCSTIHGKKQFY